ncbi:uncharacterized protein EHS24_002238 [Apiotrichum porosum]|uniref:Uncharacterized protein n=1 Tax=Apiotrichum porosum TaxID=105984 RepID=A0A427XIB4_9TREE|nr:uncharacterized protein EHS24_002238 [Apiotrichum porosum]RSH78513.1 hypothetical protein EHS24_002238 [Apiotrichum porosum]
MPTFAPICNTFLDIVAFLNKNHVLFGYIADINGGGQLVTSHTLKTINVFLLDYPSMAMQLDTRKAMEQEYYKLVNRYGGHTGYREPDPSRRCGVHRLFREDQSTSSYRRGTTRQQQFEHQKAIVKHQLAALDQMVWARTPRLSEPTGHHGRYCSARASTKSLRSVGGTITSGGSTGPRTGRSNTRFHPYGKQRATLPTSAVSHTPELESDNTLPNRETGWRRPSI